MNVEILKLTHNTEEDKLNVEMINNIPIVLAAIHSALDTLAERNHISTLTILSTMLETELDYETR